MRRSCYCCMSGTYVRPGCIPYPRSYPNPRPFPPFDDPFGGCLKCGHPKSSHIRGCF